MPDVRMSLADAADALGIAVNSVRSRFKAGKIKGERDNAGKIWVWIDPTVSPSKTSASKPSIEGSKAFEIKTLEGHIQTLNEQLSNANAELSILRENASDAAALTAEVAGLEAQISLVKEDRDHWRQMAQTLVEKPSATRTRGFFGLFRRAAD